MANYPDDWNTRRKFVLRRDNYACQVCGELGGPRGTSELHVHHITPVSEGGSHSHSNLETRCRSCHASAHPQNPAFQQESEEIDLLGDILELLWLGLTISHRRIREFMRDRRSPE